jgi:hypothetical protein
VYVNGFPTYQTFIDTRSNPGGGSSDGFFFGLNNQTSTPIVFTTALVASSSVNIIASAWNHVAITRSGTTLTFWVNGVSGGTTTNSTNLSSQNVYIGGSTSGTIGVNGFLSSARIVKGTAVYTTAFTPPTAPLTAITNTSFLTNFTNGAIFDNAMISDLETVGSAQISTSVVKYGTGSLKFNGTTDYLISTSAITNLFAFGSGDFTIEFWIYPNAVSGLQIIYDQRPTGVSTAVVPVIYLNGASLRYFVNGADVITGSNLSASTWYHIAICRSGTSTKLFINGTQSGSTYTDSSVYLNYTSRPAIGFDANSVGNYYNGYIDDLRITKGYARYTTTFTPPTAAFPNTGPI